MKQTARNNLDLFVENRNAVKGEFKWASPLMHCLCALLLTAQKKSVNVETIKGYRRLMKKEVSAFSSLRGIAMPALLTQLSIIDDGEQMICKVHSAYQKLREDGFLATDYLALSAYILARNSEDGQLGRKAMQNYQNMRTLHRTLTGGDDTGFATLLALFADECCIDDSQRAFELLKPRFLARNETWLMAHILAFDTEHMPQNAERTIELFDKLKERKIRFRSTECPMLAVLALLMEDLTEAIELIEELSLELKDNKGFSVWQISKGQRQLYSTVLIALSALENGCQEKKHDKLFYITLTTMLITITMATIQAASAAAAQ